MVGGHVACLNFMQQTGFSDFKQELRLLVLFLPQLCLYYNFLVNNTILEIAYIHLGYTIWIYTLKNDDLDLKTFDEITASKISILYICQLRFHAVKIISNCLTIFFKGKNLT